MDDQIWVAIFIGAIVLFGIYNVIRYRGFRGSMYGAEVVAMIGAVSLSTNPVAKTSVKVHILKPKDAIVGPNVGMEVGFSSVLGAWEMRPVSLTRTQARELSELLAKAASENAV